MMNAYVYIIFSKKLDRFYTGITSLDVNERLANHLSKKYGKLHYTYKADDWELFWNLPCENISQARKIELHIKKMKSKTYIKNLVKYAEISEKLLLKYKSI